MATSVLARVRRTYGAHPLHLVLLLVGLAVAAYAVQLLGIASLWNPDVWWQSIVVWFVGAALAHDLLLFPLYVAVDRVLGVLAPSAHRREGDRRKGARRPRAVPVVNFVRVPLLACGLVTLMFFPGVIRQGAASYHRATGLDQDGFLVRWLVLCAVILAAGLVAYLLASVRARRKRS